jgi:hypothetical protein
MWVLTYRGGQTDGGPAEAWLGKIAMPTIEQVMAKLLLRVMEATEGLDLMSTPETLERYKVRFELVWDPSLTFSSHDPRADESLPLLMAKLKSAVPSSGVS